MTEPGVIEERLKTLGEDMSEVKNSIAKLSDVLVKQVLIEERQLRASQEINRVVEVLDRLEKRVACLERSAPENKRAREWVERVIWLIVGVGVAALTGKSMGFTKVSSLFVGWFV